MLTSCFKSTREAGPSPHRRRVTGIVDAADRDSSEFVGHQQIVESPANNYSRKKEL